MNRRAFGGWQREGRFEGFQGAGDIVAFEADEAESGVSAGAERGDGGKPGGSGEAAGSLGMFQQSQRAGGGAFGAVELGGAGVGGEVSKVDQERNVVRRDGEPGGSGLDRAWRVALFAPGAREEFTNRQAERGGGEVAFKGDAFFDHRTVEHVEVGVVLGGRFSLQIRQKLRV